ncbi:SDR family NAD(P)-dependent oxidoreductase [Streptomyces longwoodensis]|uniref:SDR family NAD(P)-dependent oxidoreductase n=1 Tax=Streptomyces longwoodensis TaxID=68231 RepID=UPI0033E93A19
MSKDIHLVLGATGTMGRRVAARLRLHGAAVRTASRSSQIRFDWFDPGTWGPILQDAVAYAIPPPVPGPMNAFIAQAESAGVHQLVLLSGRGTGDWGSDSSFGLDMQSAEEAVRGSLLNWTILRASNFAQNFSEGIWHVPLLTGELALPAGTVPEPFIDVEDVADAAVALMTARGRHSGRIYELSGPHALTFAEAVKVISMACRKPLAYRQIAPARYAATLVEQGLGTHEADQLAEMFVGMESGLIAETTADVAAVLGRSPRTFAEFAAHAAAAGAWHAQ